MERHDISRRLTAASRRRLAARARRALPDAREVDKASLDVRAQQLDARPLADVQARLPPDHPALDRGAANPHPRALVGCAGDNRIELLAGPALEQHRGGGLADLQIG